MLMCRSPKRLFTVNTQAERNRNSTNNTEFHHSECITTQTRDKLIITSWTENTSQLGIHHSVKGDVINNNYYETN